MSARKAWILSAPTPSTNSNPSTIAVRAPKTERSAFSVLGSSTLSTSSSLLFESCDDEVDPWSEVLFVNYQRITRQVKVDRKQQLEPRVRRNRRLYMQALPHNVGEKKRRKMQIQLVIGLPRRPNRKRRRWLLVHRKQASHLLAMFCCCFSMFVVRCLLLRCGCWLCHDRSCFAKQLWWRVDGRFQIA